MKTKILWVLLLCSNFSYSQDWFANGSLNNGFYGHNLGTFNNYPINIYTGGTHIAQFTTGSSLNCLVGNFGDGLRIRNTYPSGVGGNLDMFTSYSNGQNETIF